MKTLRFFLVLFATFFLGNLCAQEVEKVPVVKVYKNGTVVSEVVDADSVVYEQIAITPTVDRNVYLDENCTTQPINGFNVVSGESDITGASWSDYSTYAFKCPSNATLLNMKVPFKVYTRSLFGQLEIPSNGIAEYDSSCKSWWVSGFENGTVIILALQ